MVRLIRNQKYFVKNNILFLILSFSFITDFYSQATASDCVNAVNICTNSNFAVDPNGSGNTLELDNNPISNPSINPSSSNSGCLLAGELNPTWMIINVASNGTLEFSFGADGGAGCLDWIMWQYSPSACTQIINNQLAPVRCNWNGICESFTGIANTLPTGGDPVNFEPPLNVTAGQQYLICLSNYSSQTTNVPLNFFGTANVSCNSVSAITVNSPTICSGQSITLTASGSDNYVWSPGGLTGPSITVSPTSTTTYNVTGSTTGPTGGTINASGSGTVTVLPVGSAQCGCVVNASNNGPVCPNDPFTLTASNVTGGTYTWTLNGNTVGNSQSLTGQTQSQSGNYTYTVTAIDNLGHTCTSTTTVVIRPLPAVVAGNDVTTCYNSSVTLTASGANSYTWSPVVQNGVAFNPSTSGIYTVIGTDINGCKNTDEVNVTLVAASIPQISPSVNVGCAPLAVNFSFINTCTQADWSFGNGQTASGCGIQSTIYQQPGCFDVFVQYTDLNGCDSSATFNDIICVEKPKAAFYVNPPSISQGNSTINFFNVSQGAVTYWWDLGDGTISAIENPNHTYATAEETGFVATLVAISPSGCTDTTTLAIIYEEQLIFYVPNAFTPDADEHNQTFKPVFTSGFDPYNFEMVIYNRWGEIVFKSQDHTKGWDGSFGYKGLDVQTGVYTWIIKFKPKNTDNKVTINGIVNVLR